MQLGVKSVEIGGRVLHVLTEGGCAMALNEIAERTGLSPSSAHRYLVSLARAGFVRQDAATRLYDLGPFAAHCGIAAVGRSQLLAVAEEAQRELRKTVDESVVLAVWGTYGPVILKVAESSKPISMTMRVGTTMPLMRTATGWVCSAFLPRHVVEPVIRSEMAAGRGPVEPVSEQALGARLSRIQESRLAAHYGDLLPGVSAVATPLLGFQRELIAVLSVFGHSEDFDPSTEGQLAATLKRCVQAFSKS